MGTQIQSPQVELPRGRVKGDLELVVLVGAEEGGSEEDPLDPVTTPLAQAPRKSVKKLLPCPPCVPRVLDASAAVTAFRLRAKSPQSICLSYYTERVL